jgi:hypothetical protein
MTSKAVHYRVCGPTQSGTTVVATRCTKGENKPGVGQHPPYGMIGGIEETSASFEARSAPRSYPTRTDIRSAKLSNAKFVP